MKTAKKEEKIEQPDLEGKYLRAMADYQNLEKRVERERETFVKFANTVLILKMLPILDNLERAAEHLKDQGIELVVKEFRQSLESEGVAEIEASEATFNPEVHEAIEQVEGESGKVVEVLEKGYKLGEKVIRPAKVKIGGKK